MSKQVRRLFEQFQPESYILDLTPDAASMRFHGSVTITGKKTGRPSQRITLHQKGLTFKSATVLKHGKKDAEEIAVSRINNQDSYDEVRIHSQQMFYPGVYTITLHFEGIITKAMHGLYPCYFEHDGRQKMLLATQFESHHAREVFPCIDEPEAKATFDLILTTPPHEQTLANTPTLKQENTDNNLKKTTFETTPIMSTYLLAFVIGEMHSVEGKTIDGIEMRSWGTVAQPINKLSYANSQAIRIIEFFTDYYKTPFPLKKCDQVALPDFASGAMENWGLITYRESVLLTDPQNRSISGEQHASEVIAHELAHQWFGNLVTMKWWDDLWLNESFATMMAHLALNELHPEWAQWEEFTSTDVISSSSRDIYKDVQSVHIAVNHPDEIASLFDPAIVYAKGGRLLKMIREYIGDEAFRSALQSYFKKHAYKNTVGDDLWIEMSAASGKDIKSFMDPWINQSGMPVVDVTHSKDTIELRQKRFVLDSKDDSSLWPVPLLADQNLEIQEFTVPKLTINRPIDAPTIFNQNGSGHMLVNYIDQPTRDYVSSAFAEQKLKPESRINILNDLLLLARGNVTPLSVSFDVIAKATSEPRDAVWAIMSRSIATGLMLVEGDDNTEKRIKAFRASLVREWHNKLGWDDNEQDTPNDKLLRQTVLSMMLASEDEQVTAEAIKRYKQSKSLEDLPAEQRALILVAIVRSGENVIDTLIDQYKSTQNPDIQLAICLGLTSTRDPVVGDEVIEKAIGKGGFVRAQDVFRWYAYLMRNRYTRTSAWRWLQTNWERLDKELGEEKSFDYFIAFSANPISTSSQQKEFVDFFTPMLKIVSLERNIKIALAEIEARVAWRTREELLIQEYFKSVQ